MAGRCLASIILGVVDGLIFYVEDDSPMKKWVFLASLLLIVAVGRLAAQNASANYDKNTDFSKYKTYKWVNIENAQHVDDLTADQLAGTVESELAKKGLKKSQTDKADLLIGYQVARGKEKQLSQYNVGASYGSAAGATGGTGGAATTVVHTGLLVLDMYDAASKQLIWRGVVANAIDADAKPDKKQKHMDQGVAKLLKDYPPQKK
jgi:hypothetical protein